MVASYGRFEAARVFGVVCSPGSNCLAAPEPTGGAVLAVAPALEDVRVWNIKSGELQAVWHDESNSATVSVMAQSPSDSDIYAVGYSDGSIRLWNATAPASPVVTLNGHRSRVTCLEFDETSLRLFSAGQDTTIVVWDLVAETGVCRLNGHMDQVTGLKYIATPHESENDAGWLVSCGKDSYIKVWDLTSQHCVETLADHRGPVWAFAFDNKLETLLSAGQDPEVKIWSVDLAAFSKQHVYDNSVRRIRPRGDMPRTSRERPCCIAFHPELPYVVVQTADRSVQIYKIRSSEELAKLAARRQKRKGEKAREAKDILEPKDSFILYANLRTSAKAQSAQWVTASKRKGLQLLITQSDNQISLYSIVVPGPQEKVKADGTADYEKVSTLELEGHRTDVRTLALTGDDQLVASGAGGSVKLWNVSTGRCIRTFESEYCLCSAFILQDKYIVMGYKNGKIQIFDVASASAMDEIDAHKGPVWAIDVHPDGKSLVTVSADKTMKFWDIRVVQSAVMGSSRTFQVPDLKQSRILKLEDDALSVKHSPDGKLVAVSLLDNTVKVFYHDTLKFYLSLYGHKLPVLCMDIAFDSKILVTCSADKNIKIWGLDFGDCRKSIFAHQDSIMQVKFLHKSHHFVSCSKDKMVKTWDGHHQIQKLSGFHGEVWAMAVGNSRPFIVAAAHDKSIRTWEIGDDLVFLEEEREREEEEMHDQAMADSANRADADMMDEDQEATRAGKQTVESLMAGERLAEALEIGYTDKVNMDDYEEKLSRGERAALPQRHPAIAINNIRADEYVLQSVERIKSGQLDDAMLVLSFENVLRLLEFADIWAARQMNVLLTCRILYFILQNFYAQLVANRIMRTRLDSIRKNVQNALQKEKNTIGYNLAALKFMQREQKLMSVSTFEEAAVAASSDGDVKKRVYSSLA